MGIKEKVRSYLGTEKTTVLSPEKKKEIRMFNIASDIGVSNKLPHVPWFFNAQLGIPRNVNILEIRQYAKSAWVQMVCNAITKQLMTTEWKIVPVDEKEDVSLYKEQIEKIETFLKFPNRNKDTFWDVWGAWLRDVLEIDAGVIYKARNVKGELVELFNYDASRFLIKLDAEGHGIIEGYYQYSFTNFQSQPMFFENNEIIYGRVNRIPEFFPYGFSPLQSIQQEVEVMIQSTRYNKEFFKNNAMPDGIVGVDMDEDNLTRFKSYWEQTVMGKPHKLMFHNAKDMNFVNLKTSNRDMEWLDGQKWFFHTVFGAYGLSPAEVGFYDDVNRASQEGQERTTIKNAIKPYLKLIDDKINREVLPEFEEGGLFKFKWFLHDSEAEKTKHDQMMSKLSANVYTINEVRAMEGKEPVEWGDKPFSMAMQDRFIANGGSERFEGKREVFGNKPKDKEEEDKKEEPEEKKKSYFIEKDYLDDGIIDVEESEEYADFLKKNFRKIEEKVNQFLESELKDELIGKDIDYMQKSLGSFLQRLFNIVNTTSFMSGLKRVIRYNLKQGVEKAEKDLNIDIGFTPLFEDKLDFLVHRQLYGFHVEGGQWNGIKGVSSDLQKEIASIVRQGQVDKKGFEGIKDEIKDLMTRHIGGEVDGKVTEGRAMRIARTETNRWRNQSQLDAYMESGVKGRKEWFASGLDKMCPTCKHLDGTKVEFNKSFEYEGKRWMAPPAHSNCQCTITFTPN